MNSRSWTNTLVPLILLYNIYYIIYIIMTAVAVSALTLLRLSFSKVIRNKELFYETCTLNTPWLPRTMRGRGFEKVGSSSPRGGVFFC